MNFTVIPVAELEAAEAAIWYEDQRAGLGSEFLDELTETFDRIRSMPENSARLEYYSGPHDVRRQLLERFSYLVIFVFRPDGVIVVAVSHTRRRPLYWLDRLR